MDRTTEILQIAKDLGTISASDLSNRGISRTYLFNLCKEGKLVKTARGIYTLPNYPITENWNLIQIAKKAPNAVVSLLSALSFHNITTQLPHEVWIALPKSSWKPTIDYPPLNITFISGEAYSFGIEEHILSGTSVNIYSPAKTVADCFKFKNKVGLDVAIEALKDVWRDKKATIDDITKAAEVNRVLKVMMPYMEAIVA